MRLVAAFFVLLGPAACAPATAPRVTPEPLPRPSPSAARPRPIASVAPLPPPSPTTPPPTPAPAAPTGNVGTAHPVLVKAAAPDGRWTVVCQARDGAGPRPFLVAPEGAGTAIDDYLGSDPTGRWLAVVWNGRLVLLDVQTKTDVDLSARGASLATDDASFRPHRAASFGARGSRFLYLRSVENHEHVVVRDLRTQAEVETDPGDGLFWRAELDPTESSVLLRVVTTDTGRNGRLDWPIQPAGKPLPPCTSALPAFRGRENPGDVPEARLAPAAGGAPRVVPGFVATFGTAVIHRDPDETLHLAEPDGTDRILSAKKCAGRILHSDPQRGILLVACKSPKGRGALRLVQRGSVTELGVEIDWFADDRALAGSPRLVPFYATDGTLLYDLDARIIVPVGSADDVVATHGANALLRRGGSLIVFDVETKTETTVGDVTPFADIVLRDPIAVVSPWVVDLGAGRALGRFSGRPLAVTETGRVLVATIDGDATRLPMGPLRWAEAR